MSQNSDTDLSFLKINRDQPITQPKSQNGVIFLISIIVVLIGAIIIWMILPSSSEVLVEADLVTLNSQSESNSVLVSNGYVVAQRKASVASKETGRLEFLAVIEGDKVYKNQIIGRLEKNDVEAAHDQAQAQVEVSKANLKTSIAEFEEAEANFKRQESLLKQNHISQAEFEVHFARYKRAKASVESAQAGINASESNAKAAAVGVENTNIRAPFDGVVLTKNANVGEVISPFGAASGSRGNIVTIADMESLEVEAEVSEQNIQKIKENVPCEIMLEAYPNVRYPGFVNKIVPTADRTKATILVKIRFSEKDAKVLPEMRAKVTFLSGETKTIEQSQPKLTVPIQSILSENNQHYVFIIEENKIYKKSVTLGLPLGNRMEVISGLISGQKVVRKPTSELTDGLTIKLK